MYMTLIGNTDYLPHRCIADCRLHLQPPRSTNIPYLMGLFQAFLLMQQIQFGLQLREHLLAWVHLQLILIHYFLQITGWPWLTAGGPLVLGTIPVSYTLTLAPEGSGTPIANAEVHISTDPAGLNVIAAGITNVLGELVINGQTVFWLPKGTFYYWRSKAGYSFTNPDTEVVI